MTSRPSPDTPCAVCGFPLFKHTIPCTEYVAPATEPALRVQIIGGALWDIRDSNPRANVGDVADAVEKALTEWERSPPAAPDTAPHVHECAILAHDCSALSPYCRCVCGAEFLWDEWTMPNEWTVTRLYSALENYGRHHNWCAWKKGEICDCGLSDILNERERGPKANARLPEGSPRGVRNPVESRAEKTAVLSPSDTAQHEHRMEQDAAGQMTRFCRCGAKRENGSWALPSTEPTPETSDEKMFTREDMEWVARTALTRAIAVKLNEKDKPIDAMAARVVATVIDCLPPRPTEPAVRLCQKRFPMVTAPHKTSKGIVQQPCELPEGHAGDCGLSRLAATGSGTKPAAIRESRTPRPAAAPPVEGARERLEQHVEDVLRNAQLATKPQRDRELEGENITAEVMEFRMNAGGMDQQETFNWMCDELSRLRAENKRTQRDNGYALATVQERHGELLAAAEKVLGVWDSLDAVPSSEPARPHKERMDAAIETLRREVQP